MELIEGAREEREGPPKLTDAQLHDTATHGGMVHAGRCPLHLQLKESQRAGHYLPPVMSLFSTAPPPAVWGPSVPSSWSVQGLLPRECLGKAPQPECEGQ